MGEPPGVSRRQATVLGGLTAAAPLLPAVKGTVTHYGPAAGSPDYTPLDRFVMRKPPGGRDRSEGKAAHATMPAAVP